MELLVVECMRAVRTMKEVFKTLSLASVLSSVQVSMTLYNQSPAHLPPVASENITAVEGEDVIFRLTSFDQIINQINSSAWPSIWYQCRYLADTVDITGSKDMK